MSQDKLSGTVPHPTGYVPDYQGVPALEGTEEDFPPVGQTSKTGDSRLRDSFSGLLSGELCSEYRSQLFSPVCGEGFVPEFIRSRSYVNAVQAGPEQRLRRPRQTQCVSLGGLATSG